MIHEIEKNNEHSFLDLLVQNTRAIFEMPKNSSHSLVSGFPDGNVEKTARQSALPANNYSTNFNEKLAAVKRANYTKYEKNTN